MRKSKNRFLAIIVMLTLFIFWVSISTAYSSNNLIQYPLTPLIPTLYDQGYPATPNFCGPGSLQSVIQLVNQYNDGTPTNTVNSIPRATLWAFMRDTPCSALGGRDNPLQGAPIGHATNQVRKLNIAFDMGVDPHAMAWTMWTKTYSNHFYHYWIYYNSADEATRFLLYTLEKYHEPVIVAVWHGSHWVFVYGYEAEGPAAIDGGINNVGEISRIKVGNTLNYNPSNDPWIPYNSGQFSWLNFYFNRYNIDNSNQDPDPATGWYVPPPSHWQGNLVTIERDGWGNLNPDHGMSLNGPISPNPNPQFVPIILNDPY